MSPPNPSRSLTNPLSQFWKSLKEKVNLKNFTIISIVIILIGILTTTFPSILVQNSSQTITLPTNSPLDFKDSPKSMKYYNFQNDQKPIRFTTYGGLSKYFSQEKHTYYHDFDKEVILELLENNYQDEYLRPLVETIKKSSSNQNIQARIAVSLVQHIPYDLDRYYNTLNKDKFYPYETLYRNKGVCEDKSLLLAYLLNELGFDTVLFIFPEMNHMTVGIKCSSDYDFYDSGYAFIESTAPTIITDIPDNYRGGGKVTSNFHIIHLNGGTKVMDVSREYRDAIRMKELNGHLNANHALNYIQYAELWWIPYKYDLNYET